MRKDGSQRHQITPSAMDVGDPDWSPDGKRIVFQSPADPSDDQHPQVYTIHPVAMSLKFVSVSHDLPLQRLCQCAALTTPTDSMRAIESRGVTWHVIWDGSIPQSGLPGRSGQLAAFEFYG
jgi:dipeptidyl aminopeptidase/acylaminoacyl peptidase